MGAVVGVVALVVALVGFLVTLGNAGYLAMLSSAAKKRGLSGESTMEYVKGQRALAGGLAVVGLLGLLIVLGSGPVGDVFGLLLAGGSGLAGYRALNSTRERFRGSS
ncbi:hypothetical protein [Pseudonocardia acaciae]|uniref:hypothetical protein n=1 Tax=Pseudonocardia acaciae TaxID=551276 RepID=UPI000490B3DE|nr:hypothetical protein [Pseudonocardia acaciae]